MSFKPASLILADGTIYTGFSFGYDKSNWGEVVFNTSLTGYQEILTDPSYFGQIVVMTYPEIGNTGINNEDGESKRPYLSGFVVKNVSSIASNYRSRTTLQQFLKKNRIPGLFGVDTRALVRHIREAGAMPALLHVGPVTKKIIEKAKSLPSMEGQNLAEKISTSKPYPWKQGSPVVVKKRELKGQKISKAKKVKPRFKVIAYDFGIKQNILRLLVDHGCKVEVVPANYPAEKVLRKKPHGVFLSNGPGDPATCQLSIGQIQKLLGKVPLFGICLGHQLLGLALGASTYKLKFGHHGGNQPVMDFITNKVEISSQNHGFAVDTKSLPQGASVTHINLNDQTVEGLAHEKLKAFSVQYHPEAGPGPHDSHYLFQRFVELMEKNS